MKNEVFSVKNISYTRGDDILNNINFSVYEGDVLGIVGMNGVGKSVLADVLVGVKQQDSGSVFLNGGEVRFAGFIDAGRNGVGYVGQDMHLFPNMSVADNLFVGTAYEKMFFLFGRSKYIKAGEFLRAYDFSIDVHEKVKDLAYAQKKIVQLVRQLILDPKLLIIDDFAELVLGIKHDLLDSMIKKLRQQKRSVIILSHNLTDILQFSSRIMVLHNGMVVAEFIKNRVNERKVARILYNYESEPKIRLSRSKEYEIGDEVLRVENLTSATLKSVSFSLRKGEILGINVSTRSGKADLVGALSGMLQCYIGDIYIEGEKIRINSVRDALQKNISACYEDVREDMLIYSLSATKNISLNSLNRVCKYNVIQKKWEQVLVDEYCRQFGIEKDLHKKLSEMNNATLMKIAIIKCLLTVPRVIILDEPLRTIDTQGKAELQDILLRLRHTCGIIILYSNHDYSFQIFDRMLMMRKGRIIGELSKEKINYRNIENIMERDMSDD